MRIVRALATYLRRLVLTVAGATLAVFVAIEISIPRGFRAVALPAGLDDSTPRGRAVIDQFHLDEPVVVRWLHWLVDILGGDWGRSLQRGGVPVLELIQPRLSISLEFVIVSVIAVTLIGVPLGLLAAVWSGRAAGTLLNVVFGLSQSVPVFVTPPFLIWLFAIQLRWLPAASWVRISESVPGNLRSLALPATALILAEVGIVARVIRADALRVFEADYITAAVAKGLSPSYIAVRHALRPASLGLLNIVALNIGSLLSGIILVEFIFGIGGMGQLVLGASLGRDLYLLLAITTYVVVVYVTLNSIVDGLMGVLDPRINPPERPRRARRPRRR